MPKVSYTTQGKNPYRKILMHCPELEAAWDVMAKAMKEKTGLPADLREQVRATLAAGRGCKH